MESVWYEVWSSGNWFAFFTEYEVKEYCTQHGIDRYDVISWNHHDMESTYTTYDLSGNKLHSGTV